MRTFRFIRLWIIPLISLILTFIVPVSNHLLWLLWGIAFVCTCESNCSTFAFVRPAIWIGVHMIPILSQLIR